MTKIMKYNDFIIQEDVNIKELWKKTSDRVKQIPLFSRKAFLKNALFSLLTIGSVSSVIQSIQNSNADDNLKKEAIETVDKIKFDKGSLFTLSQKGWDHIKTEENLKLKAYKLGDGMVTVGYGHAEPVKKTKLKVGQKISLDDAKRLLKEDLTETANGVRRIFSEWESAGIDVKITQPMFDALVSIAFNTGVSGLRNSKIMKYLKSRNYEKAAESILDFKTNRNFPGLKLRRQKEYDLFIDHSQK